MSRGALEATSPKATRKLAGSCTRCVRSAKPTWSTSSTTKSKETTTPKFAPAPRTAQWQLAVLVLVGHHHRPVGEDDVRRDEVVDGQAMRAGEQPDPAGGRQAAHTHRAAVPGRQRPAVRLQRGGDVPPAGAGADADEPCGGVEHVDAVQMPEVDDDAAVVRRATAKAVPAASDAEGQVRVTPGEADGVDDLLDRAREQHDAGRTAAEVRRRQPAVRGIARLHGCIGEGRRDGVVVQRR